jgi:citrate synthase
MSASWSPLLPSLSSLQIPSLDVQRLVKTLTGAFGGRPTQTTEESLSVTDSRTGKTYIIPIECNAIKANAFREIQGNRVGSLADYVDGGLKVLDPGYQNTAVVESSITLIDGKRGSIHFRGHSLDELVEKHDWEEVVYLINWGKLPSMDEKLRFRKELAASMIAPQAVIDVIRALPRDAHVSSMILAGLAAFASCDEGSIKVHASGKPYYLGNMKNVDAAIPRTLSALAVTLALTYCHKKGIEHAPVDPNGTFIGNLLLMMGFAQDGKPDAKIERCFEKLWILYADHEMTNSTSGFLHASSSLTDPISSVGAAVVSAYGPLHAAAIECAYVDFENIGTPENVPAFIETVKEKKQRLFGYGHRIYKAVDPRAKWIQAMVEEHRDRVYSNPMLKVAMEVDRIASTDPYFVSRNLKVNCDLYGCFLYTAMGFDTDIIVGMAALSRSGGLMAHWREAMQEKANIWRPQQIYTGIRA